MAKHRQYGMNVQIVADLHGRVLGVSRGFPGSWHGMHCSTDAGLTIHFTSYAMVNQLQHLGIGK